MRLLLLRETNAVVGGYFIEAAAIGIAASFTAGFFNIGFDRVSYGVIGFSFLAPHLLFPSLEMTEGALLIHGFTTMALMPIAAIIAGIAMDMGSILRTFSNDYVSMISL